MIAALLIFAVVVATQNASLHRAIRPRIALQFGPKDEDCVYITIFGGTRGRMFRVRVLANETTTCSGHLIDISREGMQLNAAGSVSLTFSPAEEDDALNKRVVKGVPAYLDIGFVLEGDDHFQPATRFKDGRRFVPNEISDVFTELGDYQLGIVVVGAVGKPQQIDLLLHNTGDWVTADIEQWHAAS